MKWRRLLLAAALTVSLGAGAVWGVSQWRKSAVDSRARETLASVERLLADGKPADARTLFRSTTPPGEGSALDADWFRAEVRLALATRQWQKLRRLQKLRPEEFARIPGAVGWIERLDYLSRSPGSPLDPPPSDPLVRIDELLAAGDRDTALEALSEPVGEDADRVNRLARLALLHSDDSAAAWELLNQAYAIDSENADVRTFSANLLEKNGQRDRARAEYVAAFLLSPDNPRMRDNLAEFYIRHGLVALAVETWKTAKPVPANAPLQLKAWFWNRVVFGGDSPLAGGDSEGLLGALAGLVPGAFWSTGLEAVVGANPALAERREVFWLRVLEFLRSGEDRKAWLLLSGSDPSLAARHPFLRESLLAILAARIGEVGPSWSIPETKRDGHPFWVWLADHLGDAEALRKPWVIPALLAVSGWMRAGLDLGRPETLEAGMPDWAVFTLARSAQLCGDEAAFRAYLPLASAAAQPVDILRAQLAWAEGREQEGRDILERLLPSPEAGYRAAWLLGLYFLNRGELDDVRRVVDAQPDFANSIPGRELLARVHLLRDEEAAAVAIYEAMGDASDEARVFLARKAFVEQDWERAEALTSALAAEHPGEPQFVRNLDAIRAARDAAR